MSLARISTTELQARLDKSKSRLERIQITQELLRRNKLSNDAKDRASAGTPLPTSPPVDASVSSGYSTMWDVSLDSGQETTKDAITLQVEELARRLPDTEKFREYQEAGIEFALRSYKKWNGVMLAHFAGAGKTRTSAAILKLSNSRRTLFLTKKGGGLVKKTAQELNNAFKLMQDTNEVSCMAFPILSELNVPKSMVRSQFDVVNSLPNNVVVVTNYESLNTFPWLFDFEFDFLVVDEVHKLKGGADYNPTKIWKNTKDFVYVDSNEGVIPKDILKPRRFDTQLNEYVLVKNPAPLPTNVKKFLFLTGTPTSNHPKEYWAYLNIFNPRLFDSKKVIADTFEAIRNGLIKLDEADVIKMLTPMMHRLTKEDVADQLPEIVYFQNDIPLSADSNGAQSQSEAYEKARELLLLELDNEAGDTLPITNAISKLTRLRQIVNYGDGIDIKSKLRSPMLTVNPDTGEIEYMYDSDGEVKYEEHIETSSIKWKNNSKLLAIIEKVEELWFEGEKCVIFSAQYNDPLYHLKKHFDSLGLLRAEIIDGTTKNAADLVDEWQAGKIDVLLLNAKVAAEGLNLQRSPKWEGGANHCIFIDKWWSPSIQMQAIARLHRLDTIGTVFVHYFRSMRESGLPTVDGLIDAVLEDKQWWIDNVDDNERFRHISKAKLKDLF